jgi:hypothetical protein
MSICSYVQFHYNIQPIHVKRLHIFSLHPPISAVHRQVIPHAAGHDTGCQALQNAFDICSDISFPSLLHKKCELSCRAPEFDPPAM